MRLLRERLDVRFVVGIGSDLLTCENNDDHGICSVAVGLVRARGLTRLRGIEARVIP
ncbi:MAG: hypothetical protein ACE5O2_00325 [Armatimonadota bacterium]